MTTTTTTGRVTAERVHALTPPDRNRYADLLRVASVAVVVLGHWLLAVVTVADGELRAASLLAVSPWTQWLTWIFQVMPVFFFVGGYANAAAWSTASRRGDTWADWVRGRARRLLRPIVPLLALWVPLAAVLAWIGVPAELVRLGTQVVVVPTWFLSVYLIVVAAVPATYAAHRRRGATALVGLVVVAAAVDAAHLAGVPVVGWANFFFVWAAVHQAGYLWHDGRLPRGLRAGLVVAGAGFVTLAALITVAGYPISMVGVDGAARTNNSPPTVALIALGVAQLGLVVAVRGRVERLLVRPRAWFAVVTAGSVVMTVYLWHMTALVALVAGLHATGMLPAGPVDAGWWLTRPVWFGLLGVVLAGLVAVFGRFERAGPARPHRSRMRAALGVAATTAGLGLLVLGGLHRPGFGVPLTELALLTLGLGALGVLRRPAGRRRGASCAAPVQGLRRPRRPPRRISGCCARRPSATADGGCPAAACAAPRTRASRRS